MHRRKQLCQRRTAEELCDDERIALLHICIEDPHDTGMIEVDCWTEHGHQLLLYDGIIADFPLDQLDGHGLRTALVDRLIHRPKATLSDLLL